MRKNLKFLGIWNIVFGILFMLSIIFLIFGVLLLISGIIFLEYQKLSDEELLTKKSAIMTWSIVFLICNIVSAIIGFIIYDKLSDMSKNKMLGLDQNYTKPEPKEVIDPEIKKMDIMLKLGTGLVILSGFIIATSNWSAISDQLKVFLLLLLSALFYGLSYISKVKLKLKKSEIIYYSLSILFISFSLVAIGHFGVLGEYLSFNGEGAKLYNSIMFFSVALLSYITFYKYKKKCFIYFIFASLTLTEMFLLSYINLDFATILLLNSIIIILNKLFKYKGVYSEELNKYLDCYVYFISVSTFFYCSYLFIKFLFNRNELVTTDNFKIIFTFIVYLLNIIYIYIKSIKNQNRISNVFAPIIGIINGIIVLSLFSLLIRSNIGKYGIYITLLVCVIFMLISLTKKENKKLFVSTFILANIILLINFFFAYSVNNYLPMLVALTMLIINVAVNVDKSDLPHLKIEKYLQPFKIILLVFSAFIFFQNKLDLFNEFDFFIIASFVILTVYFSQKNKGLKYTYYLSSSILSIIYFICSLTDVNLLFKMLNIIILGVLTLISFKSEDKKYSSMKYGLYAVSGLAIFNTGDFVAGCYDFSLLMFLIMTIFITFVAYLSRNNKKIYGINLCFILFSVLSLARCGYVNNIYMNIIVNFSLIFLSLVVTRVILNEVLDKTKNILEMVFISIILIFILFIPGIEYGLYIGIISLLFLLFGARDEKYYSLFYIGLGFTILNIIVQFKDLWQRIPFPIYLLIAGLILIGVVMYKEYNKNKITEKKMSKEKVENKLKEIHSGKIVATIAITLAMLITNGIYLSTKEYRISSIKEGKLNEKILNEIKKNSNIDFSKLKIKLHSFNNSIETADIYIESTYKVSLKNIANKIKSNNKYAKINIYRVQDLEDNGYLQYYNYEIKKETNLYLEIAENIEYIDIYDDIEYDNDPNVIISFDEYNYDKINLKFKENYWFNPGIDDIICYSEYKHYHPYKKPDFKYDQKNNDLNVTFYNSSICRIEKNTDKKIEPEENENFISKDDASTNKF